MITTHLFYYVSVNIIDQLYKNEFGPIKETEVTKEKDRGAKLSVSATLDKLIKILIPINANISGQYRLGNKEINKTKIIESPEDRIAVLIKNIYSKKHLPNIESLSEDGPINSLYWFSSPIKIRSKVGSNTNNIIVEVSHKSNKIEFYGTTSEDNWISTSILNNLLFSSKSNEIINLSGIAIPISVNFNSTIPRIIVQFVIICNPIIV